MSAVQRLLPDRDAADLLDLVGDIARAELAPRAAAGEEAGVFPREVIALLGRAGLLGLPYPEEIGGGGVPYEVYLQVLEELGSAWATVALTVSVHTLSCFPLAGYGTPAQQAELLGPMLAGELLGGYALSEPDAGSDAAALSTRATATPDGWSVTGTKAWITHAGAADRYALMARTGGPGARGISCLMVDADTPGLTVAPREHKMGFRASPTAQLRFDDAPVPAGRLVGAEGQGFQIAMAALDSGRLGIAAVAVGIAQAALDVAAEYTGQRVQFGRPVREQQGLSFLLADMAVAVDTARATYLDAARRRDRGMPFARHAAVAKVHATDACMKVTTDAVQALGGAGYVADHPVERLFREAKLLQIVEGTNQVQRMVIGRHLSAGR